MKRVHVISGATSGMGAAITASLQAQGDEVIPIIRSKSDLLVLKTKRWILCDYTQPEKILKELTGFDTKIDSFINSAGIALGKPIWDTDFQEASNIINVNLISPMLVCGALHNNFKIGAAVILISSQSSFRGGWDDIYNASKGGINSFIKSFAIKMAPNVRVIGIAPGITNNTRMTNERKMNDLHKIQLDIPLRRLANVEEISDLTLALLGNAGAYMTGCIVDINGGNYLR
jgi:NAD(P)-dependent dehydrogenase (short-subunit alcohol dehydrogenase family)